MTGHLGDSIKRLLVALAAVLLAALLPLSNAAAAAEPDREEGEAPADIAISADGRLSYRLIGSPEGTRLVVLDLNTNAVLRTVALKDEGRLLAVDAQGRRACVLGPKASGGKHSPREARKSQWFLTLVDLSSGAVTQPVVLGFVPSGVALYGESRLFIATRDRIATWTLDPIRTSWYYNSPGDNRDVAVSQGSPDGSQLVVALRGRAMVVIDPSRRPRTQGRVQLTSDDATATIPLPVICSGVALGGDPAVAAALGDDGVSLLWVDVAGGRLIRTQTLGGPHAFVMPAMLGSPPRLQLAGSDEPDDNPPVQIVEAPHVEPAALPVAQAEPSLQATPQREAEAAPDSPPKPAAEPAASLAEPEPKVAQQAPPEPRSEAAPQPPPKVADEPAAPAPAAPAPVTEAPRAEPLPPRASNEPFLSGTITGAAGSAKEVLLYGPNNILKLQARATVGPDGAWRIPLPATGTYRVVVSGGQGVHLFTHPEFRTIVITQSGETAPGMAGIDFEVRGSL